MALKKKTKKAKVEKAPPEPPKEPEKKAEVVEEPKFRLVKAGEGHREYWEAVK